MLELTSRKLNDVLGNLVFKAGFMVWATDGSYHKNIYLSPKCQALIGDYSLLFADFRKFFKKKLVRLDQYNEYENIIKKLDERNTDRPSSTYCIYDKNNAHLYMEDTLLCSARNEFTKRETVIGATKIISYQEYYQNNTTDQPLSFLKNEFESLFNDIYKNNIKIAPIDESTQKPYLEQEGIIKIDNVDVKATKREAECLRYLLEGSSSKKIAKNLNISARTVEIHINNLKRKVNVTSRIELLAKINNTEK